MADDPNDSEDTPCSNPSGVAGDIWRDTGSSSDRILIKKCSPYGNWVEIGSELKSQD